MTIDYWSPPPPFFHPSELFSGVFFLIHDDFRPAAHESYFFFFPSLAIFLTVCPLFLRLTPSNCTDCASAQPTHASSGGRAGAPFTPVFPSSWSSDPTSLFSSPFFQRGRKVGEASANPSDRPKLPSPFLGSVPPTTCFFFLGVFLSPRLDKRKVLAFRLSFG